MTSQKDVQAALTPAKEVWRACRCGYRLCRYFSSHQGAQQKEELVHTLKDFQVVLNVKFIGTFNVICLVAGETGQDEPDQGSQPGDSIKIANVLIFDSPPPPLLLCCSSSDTEGPPMDINQPRYIKLKRD